MRKIAGGGRAEKPPGGECRREPIPETTWRRVEKLLEDDRRRRQGEPVTAEDAPPDPVVRAVLGAAVRRCAAAPVRGRFPWTAPQVVACYRTLAETARGAARCGMPLGYPRGKGTVLPWILTRTLLGYHPMMIRDDAWPLIQGAELTLLAKRAARMVKSYRHAGADTNFVRVALVAEVIRVIEVRVAVGADKLGWDEKNDRVTGLLAYIVWELLPWLPGWPCTPRGLYEALLAARTVVGRLKLRRRESPL